MSREKTKKKQKPGKAKASKQPQLEMYELETGHFQLAKTSHPGAETVLALNGVPQSANGMSLVLFSKNDCPHCTNFVPVYEKAMQYIYNASEQQQPPLPMPKFFVCQLDGDNKDIIRMSQATATPLQYVPLLMLYVNNLPYRAFSGQPDIDSVFNFIAENSNALMESQEQPSPAPVVSQSDAPSCSLAGGCGGGSGSGGGSGGGVSNDARLLMPSELRPIVGRDLRIYKQPLA